MHDKNIHIAKDIYYSNTTKERNLLKSYLNMTDNEIISLYYNYLTHNSGNMSNDEDNEDEDNEDEDNEDEDNEDEDNEDEDNEDEYNEDEYNEDEYNEDEDSEDEDSEEREERAIREQAERMRIFRQQQEQQIQRPLQPIEQKAKSEKAKKCYNDVDPITLDEWDLTNEPTLIIQFIEDQRSLKAEKYNCYTKDSYLEWLRNPENQIKNWVPEYDHTLPELLKHGDFSMRDNGDNGTTGYETMVKIPDRAAYFYIPNLQTFLQSRTLRTLDFIAFRIARNKRVGNANGQVYGQLPGYPIYLLLKKQSNIIKQLKEFINKLYNEYILTERQQDDIQHILNKKQPEIFEMLSIIESIFETGLRIDEEQDIPYRTQQLLLYLNKEDNEDGMYNDDEMVVDDEMYNDDEMYEVTDVNNSVPVIVNLLYNSQTFMYRKDPDNTPEFIQNQQIDILEINHIIPSNTIVEPSLGYDATFSNNVFLKQYNLQINKLLCHNLSYINIFTNFSFFTNLKTLSLKGVDMDISGYIALTDETEWIKNELYLQYCKWETMSEKIKSSNIQKLVINHLICPDIPFGAFKDLKHLIYEDKKKLPSNIQLLDKLETCLIRIDKIKNIPDWFINYYNNHTLLKKVELILPNIPNQTMNEIKSKLINPAIELVIR
jgi:flagellar biosynthesis GTPase FlhF